jgi:WD40 repeat protein
MSGARPFRTALAAALAALVLAAGPGPAQTPARAGGKYALLIGVNQYANRLRPLKYAQNDVEALRDVLVAHGYEPDNVWLMTYRSAATDPSLYPTRKNILTALRLLRQDRSPADSVLVAFAGHGVQFKDDTESYLCPVDADLENRHSLVSVTDVYGLLESCEAGVKLVAVDACRNDPRLDTSRSAEEIKLSSANFQPQQPPGGLAVLYSCSTGQEALEDDALQHGIFFHFLIQGLEGKAADREDGQVTVGGLYEYVSRRVDDYARSHQKHAQRPTLSLLGGELSGAMTLLTVAASAAEARPVPPPPPEPGRELRRLTGHGRTVTGVAFLPDGRRALSGSYDGTLRLWDVDAGTTLACLQSPNAGWVYAVAVSADGRFALSCGDDHLVRLWDLDSRTELRQLRGHRGRVYGVSISADGRVGLSAGEDGTVRVWDLAAGTEVRALRGHTGAVCTVALAADGRSVLSGGADHTLRLWDVDTGAELRRFEGHNGTVLSVALSGDGRLAASGGDDGTMRLWDARTGRQLRSFGGDMNRVPAVAFSPDGRRVLCGGADRALHVWDVGTGKALGTLRGHDTEVGCVAFAPDGRRALSGDGEVNQDGTVRLWQLPN